MPITFTGLSSGIDTNLIITQLERFSQTRINTLQTKAQDATSKQTLLSNLQSKLQTLQSEADTLSKAQNSVFDRRAITSSDETIVKVAAGSAADPGVQSLRVLGLAQANQIASQGFDDLNSQITQGSFQIKAGGSTATITIDSSNNTLSGLAKAINSAGVGVTASVINDGSDERTQPYRLVLSSNKTGTDNAITITNSLASDGSGAFRPEFGSTSVGQPVLGSSFSGTSTVTANSGAGNYTGTANDTFTFTVQTGGTVGTDDGIQLAYSNSSGTKAGTLTLDHTDSGVSKAVVDGVAVTLGAGSLNTGDKFSIDVSAPQIQAAKNARIQLGSGDGAIVVQNSSNQMTNLIRGVTLSLQAADPTKDIILTTTNDVAAATTEITNFVSDYNDFLSYLTKQTKFDSKTNVAGPLAGDRSVSDLRDVVQKSILSITPGLSPSANRLSALGIKLDDHGVLQIDQAKLADVLNDRVSGVTFADVKKLFTLRGQSSSNGIEFITGSRFTKSSTTPYEVDITQAAEQATLTAGNDLASSITLDSSNNQLAVSVNGKNSTLTLAEGTYTPLTLAHEVQSEINSALSSKGGSVTASLSGQKLVLNSDRYGSTSALSIDSGSALSILGFAGGETNQGQDVAGQFLVNGVAETATGLGQILTGSSSNANTADLAIQVSLTGSQVQFGVDATLDVAHGLASQLSNVLEGLLDSTNGRLKTITDRFSKNVDDAQKAITKAQTDLTTQTASLQQQFANMEQTISQLQAQSQFVLNTLSPGSSSSSSSGSKLSVAG